jgi:hypothetical protein
VVALLPVSVETPGPTPVATAPTLRRVLVMPFTAAGVSPDVADLLGQLVVGEARQRTPARVTAWKELEAALQVLDTAQLSSASPEVAATGLGRAADAEEVVGGTVTRVGPVVRVELFRVRTADGTVLARASRNLPSWDEGLLAEAVPPLVAELYGAGGSPLVPAGGSAWPRHLARGACLAVTAAGLAAVTTSALVVGGLLGLKAVDFWWRGARGRHLFPWLALVAGTVVAVVAVTLGIPGLLVTPAAGVGVAASRWLP